MNYLKLKYPKLILKIAIFLISIDSVNAKNFPVKSWESRTPAELGMSAEKLKKAADYIEMCIRDRYRTCNLTD